MKIWKSLSALFLALVLNTVNAIRTNLMCTDSPMIYSKGKLADARNCAHAMILGFPFQSEVGPFHRWAKEDIFQLPRSSTYDDCTVTVDITNDATFPSSWGAVWGLASAMNVACSRYLNTAGMLYTGGIVHSGVTITMGRTPRVGNAVNGTDLIAELTNGSHLATE